MPLIPHQTVLMALGGNGLWEGGRGAGSGDHSRDLEGKHTGRRMTLCTLRVHEKKGQICDNLKSLSFPLTMRMRQRSPTINYPATFSITLCDLSWLYIQVCTLVQKGQPDVLLRVCDKTKKIVPILH